MKKILLWGNTIFIPFEQRALDGQSAQTLYMKGSVSGLLFSGIYTEEEVKAYTKDAKEVEEGFLGVNELYYGKPRAIKEM